MTGVHVLVVSDACDSCDRKGKPGDEMVFYADKTALCLQCACKRADYGDGWTIRKARNKRQ